MVEQAKYAWREMPARIYSSENPLPHRFARRHCEKHYQAVLTILRFLNGEVSALDMLHMSLEKHKKAMLQVVSRTNVLYRDLERHRNSD